MYQTHKEYILEGQEGKNFKKARRFLETKGFNYEESMAIFGPLKQQIPNLRKNDSKFTLGVVRILSEKNLLNKDGVSDTAGDTLAEIDRILGAIETENEIGNFDEDLNGYTLDELKDQFTEKIAHADAQSRNELETQYGSNNDESYNGYTIVRIDNFEDASQAKYSHFCDWCITQDEDAFTRCTNNNWATFYFCLKNGYENIPKKRGSDTPLDTYGLSMIAVCVDEDGKLRSCTCRWNHYNDGNDHVMNAEQLSSLINANFYSVFKPKSDTEQYIVRLKNIYDEFNYDISKYEDISAFCTPINDYYGGVTYYTYESQYEDGCIIVKQNGELLLKEIFEDVEDMCGYLIPVVNNKKYNFVKPDCGENGMGCVVSNIWFDDYKLRYKTNVSTYPNHNIVVYLDGKENLLTPEGTFVFDKFCTPIVLGKRTRYNLNKQFCVYDDNGLLYIYDVREEKPLFDEAFTNIEVFGERCLLLTPKNGERTELYDIYHSREDTNKIVDILDGRGTSTNGKEIVEILNKIDGNKYWMDGSLKLYDHETKEPLIPKRNESVTHHKSTKRITERILSRLKQR